jgi:hypothetical protein
MMRRVRSLVLALVLFAPVIVSAQSADQDPNGLVATAPTAIDWLDAAVQILVVYLGI